MNLSSLSALAKPQRLRYPAAMMQTDRIAIKIYKSQRILQIWADAEMLAEYPIVLGGQPVGHKQREGDGRTPEGRYIVCVRNEQSNYHLSLGLSYPNTQDADAALADSLITQDQWEAIAQACAAGRRPPWDTPLGGAIMIHGGGIARDWTAGCIAMENDAMNALWERVRLGTEVWIFP